LREPSRPASLAISPAAPMPDAPGGRHVESCLFYFRKNAPLGRPGMRKGAAAWEERGSPTGNTPIDSPIRQDFAHHQMKRGPVVQ